MSIWNPTRFHTTKMLFKSIHYFLSDAYWRKHTEMWNDFLENIQWTNTKECYYSIQAEIVLKSLSYTNYIYKLKLLITMYTYCMSVNLHPTYFALASSKNSFRSNFVILTYLIQFIIISLRTFKFLQIPHVCLKILTYMKLIWIVL